jgi:hypothetical protein
MAVVTDKDLWAVPIVPHHIQGVVRDLEQRVILQLYKKQVELRCRDQLVAFAACKFYERCGA